MNKVIFMVGNIGSGKSYYLKNRNIQNVIEKDGGREGFGCLVGEEYIFDEIIEEFIHDIVINIYEASLHLQSELIALDETFMSVESRAPFLILAKKYGYETEAVVFKDRGMENHVAHRMLNSRGFDKEYWEEVWNQKNDRYVIPTKEEGFDAITHYSW